MKAQKYFRFLISIFLFLGISGQAVQGQNQAQNLGQKKFYIDIQGGYGIPFLSSDAELTEISNYKDWTTDSETIQQVVVKNQAYSYGKGARFGLNAGYWFNPYIGLEVGIGYHQGVNKFRFPTDWYEKGSEDDNYSLHEQDVREDVQTLKTLEFSISTIFTPGFKQWNPYLKIGVLGNYAHGVREIDKSYRYYRQGSRTTKYNQIYHDKGFFGIGVKMNIGIMYNVCEFMSVFFDVGLNAINCTPKSSELVKYQTVTYYGVDENGVWNNILERMSYRERNTKYVKENTINSYLDPGLADQAKEVLREKKPFSNINFNIGIKFRL